MPSLEAALRRLVDWYWAEALPLWARAGYDDARGGFYECLDFKAAPVTDAVRRVRVQARQVYVFASTAERLPDAEKLALAGFEYFLERACPDGGARGCVHLLTPAGAVADDRRDLYDQAFLLLACAAMHRAFRDPRALELANRTDDFLTRELSSPEGGWREDDKASLPRRQNPHMHLYEAFMALHEATGEARWLERARSVYAIFRRCLFDSTTGVLREFFTDNWSLAPGYEGRTVEPGHMAEWALLLERYNDITGEPVEDAQKALLETVVKHGAKAQRGFLVDRYVEGAANPDASARLWPQTEYLKASLIMARKGDEAAAARAEAVIEALFETYLAQPVAGLWCDRYDGAGKPIAEDVPASILYHLHEAAREAERALEKTTA